MRVQYTGRIVAYRVHRAVDDKPRRIHWEWRLHQLVALLVNFDQAAGGDFIKHHPVGVDQEVVVWAGKAGTDVGKDQVAPTIRSNQAIARCQVHPQLPLFGAN
jgi:hypothetical protein